MIRKLLTILFISGAFNAYSQKITLPINGDWEAFLIINDSVKMPVRMGIHVDIPRVFNGNEYIKLYNKEIAGDSIIYQFPVFDSKLKVKSDGKSLNGYWYNMSKGDYKMLFTAKLIRAEDEDPSPMNSLANSVKYDITGRWDAWFSPGTEIESYMIGVFDGNRGLIKGTFLSETGDYRYLQGMNNYLSTFDGAHAYFFDFKFINNDSVAGTYYSGYRWQEPFTMVRNPDAKLRDPDSLTQLKEGFNKFHFSFNDLNDNKVTSDDERFKGKVVIVQIMGSWCPNCMDETRFFNELYNTYHKDGLEIVSIAFERNDSYDDFKRNLTKLKKDLRVQYDILFGGSTKDSKEQLPMLTKLMSYPTAVFIDREGNVRKIHTGFSGPGTGEVYEQQKAKTTRFIEKLIKE